ncbi:hypothetical protein AOB54_09945 [beta proteobacterium MWH-UniP1]
MELDISNLKDWAYLIGLFISVYFFAHRLKIDTKFASYRETVSYLEKRNEKLENAWEAIYKNLNDDKKLKTFFNELDLIALLVLRKGFDEELVYNYWWKFFYQPIYVPEIKVFIEDQQAKDKAAYENYLKLVKKWEKQIKRELGYR